MSKVVVMRCTEYDLDQVYQKIDWGLKQLGGIESIIPKGKKVLLKPNLVVGSHPENAVTTHPVILEAVIKIMKEHQYPIKYGDSPGFGNPEKAANKAGLKEVADRYDVFFADFLNGETISYPEGVACKQFDIANGILETEAIINLPKMKAHALQRITGAIKNPFGAVVGYNKATMHSRYTNAYNFADMLIDLDQYLNVDLHIMDGILAMEGNGPRNGNPIKMNVIMISTDPVAMDTLFCKMVDLNHLLIPTIIAGKERGLGTYEDIEIIGDPIAPLINKAFDIDRGTVKKEDSTSLSFLRKHVIRRPYIIKDACQKCGVCVEVCPLEDKALQFPKGNKTTPPQYDYSKCIRCYCCQEMCPYHAIEVKTPVIGKVLYGTKILK